jgi:hypothetical protein
MHWLGYVLAILNLVGIITVGSLGSLDYAKRRAWTHSLYLHEVTLVGLPVDGSEVDPQGRLLTDRLSEDLLRDLFTPVGGNPVLTQMEEVARVRSVLQNQAGQGEGNQRLAYRARVLLPLSDTELEREHLLLCRNQFAAPATEATFKARLRHALTQALKPPPVAPAGRKQLEDSLEKAFRLALLEQEGGSAEPFTSELLRLLPADRKAAQTIMFDEIFAKVVALLQERYTRRLDDAFDIAAAVKAAEAAQQARSMAPISEPNKALLGDPRRVAIARLLFDVCPLLAEEAISQGRGGPKDAEILQKLSPGSAAYQDRLLDTDAYRKALERAQLIVGVQAMAAAMTEQGQLVQQMSSDLTRELVAERLQFVAAHGVLLESVLERAAQTAAEVALLAREQQSLTDQEGLVKRRQADVKQAEQELAESRARTAVEMQKLQSMSQRLFDLRVILRDTRAKNLEGEEKIRDLEKRIRDLESKAK